MKLLSRGAKPLLSSHAARSAKRPPFARTSFPRGRAFPAILVLSSLVAPLGGADLYFAGDGSALNTAKWGTSASGPFTSSFTSGSIAYFSTVNGTGSVGSITAGGVVATENFTLSGGTGTLSTGGSVISLSVAAGKTLNLTGLNFSTAAGTGYIKNGDGTLFTNNSNAYTGGFTLNAGTLVAGGINAMGGGGSNTLTLNGGTLAASANRDFTGKYGGGITIAGNVQLGALTSEIALSSSSANMIFSNTTSLGNAQRTLTIGANGTYTFSGAIGGTGAGASLTIAKLSGASGSIVLGGNNTFSGGVAVNGGTLVANHNNALGTGTATVAAGATLTVNSTITVPNAIAVSGTLTGVGSAAVSGTIGGTGTLGGALAIASGGAIAPGGSAGSLTLATGGSLTFSSGATYNWDLGSLTTSGAGTNYDLLSLAGTANLVTNSAFLVPSFLAANSAPQLRDAFWNTARSWTIVAGSGSSSITGTFQVDNSAWSSSGSFATSLSGGNINLEWTPSLSAIPEPSTYAAMAGAAALGAAVWRRRRKQ